MVTRGRRENSREGHLRALCKVIASMKQEQVNLKKEQRIKIPEG